MGMCAELADLAMQLARVAAARALTDLAGEPEDIPTAEPAICTTAEPVVPAPAATPPTAPPEPAPSPTQATYPRRAAAPAVAKPPAGKPIDPAIVFTRLAAVVRDCIALEARLASGTRASTRLSALRTDPRRAGLHEALRQATASHPDRTEILRDATDRADEELAADPEQSISPHQMFFAICEDLGIEIDLARLRDEYIGLDDDPDPRATSPP